MERGEKAAERSGLLARRWDIEQIRRVADVMLGRPGRVKQHDINRDVLGFQGQAVFTMGRW